MRGIIFGLAACVLGLMVAGESNAAVVVKKTVVSRGGYRGGMVHSKTFYRGGYGPRIGGPSYRGLGPRIGSPYYRGHAVRYGGGYYYAGRAHHHWARRVWVPSANCYHYFDADLGCYYYYDTVRLGYYPVAGGVIIR